MCVCERESVCVCMRYLRMFTNACLLNEIDTSNVYPVCVSVGEGERVCGGVVTR